jgi:hypothetical protein
MLVIVQLATGVTLNYVIKPRECAKPTGMVHCPIEVTTCHYLLESENMLDINIEAPSKAEIEQALSELKRNKNTGSRWYRHGRGTISKHKSNNRDTLRTVHQDLGRREVAG